MAKKKVSKKSRSATNRRAKVTNPKKIELMVRLEHFLKMGQRNIDSKRMEAVQKATKKSQTSIRAAFLYGEGDYDFWSKIEEVVTPINFSTLKALWEEWPVIDQKMSKIPESDKKILKVMNKLSEDEKVILSHLVEALYKASRSLEDT